ncbi:uncharacterized protein FTOL_13349 [Fusarium torulosum]|uniref:Uncharacterized protein n=1 Tax=Fusarium torulosum TaxID=33205 RepID=A0AAE8SPU2_9HYPO|nr:uncharacterized protein FTOL_13349 [Fusarium torulosum]
MTLARSTAGSTQDVFLKEVKKELRDDLRKGKAQFWEKMINEAGSRQDIFRITKWARASDPFQPPPLQIGDDIFESQAKKAAALRRATLERRSAEDDIGDPWEVEVSPSPLPFQAAVSLDEATDVVLRTGNTSPGSDNITTAFLRACWPQIADYTRLIYVCCLTLGHHPRAITFDPDKTEVMHFSRQNDHYSPPVFHGTIEKRPEESLRWLGIWLDR